jgi:hypothetical protein
MIGQDAHMINQITVLIGRKPHKCRRCDVFANTAFYTICAVFPQMHQGPRSVDAAVQYGTVSSAE